jgi:dUTP pyrophosphatase
MCKPKVRIEVLKRNEEAIIPWRVRYTDAGYDVHSLIDINIAPGDVVDIDTGMSVVAPEGYYFTVEGRSSMYKSGVVPFRGIIDSGYTGPMIVSLMNVGKKGYHISRGDRIAQLVLHELIQADFVQVDKISDTYNIRGNQGFGSSGR